MSEPKLSERIGEDWELGIQRIPKNVAIMFTQLKDWQALALEARLETMEREVKDAHRLLGKVVPVDQNDMIRWALKSGDAVYTNAGAAFRTLARLVDLVK